MTSPARGPAAPQRLIAIGDVARQLGVTPRTLRHYQDQGLVRSYRLARNARGYDLEAIQRLEAIIALRAAGLPIAAIGAVLALRDQPDAQVGALRTALAEALDEQQARVERLAALAGHMDSDATTLPPAIAGLLGRPEPTAAP